MGDGWWIVVILNKVGGENFTTEMRHESQCHEAWKGEGSSYICKIIPQRRNRDCEGPMLGASLGMMVAGLITN